MFWGGEKERRRKPERGEGHFIAGHSSPGHVYLIRRGTRKKHTIVPSGRAPLQGTVCSQLGQTLAFFNGGAFGHDMT